MLHAKIKIPRILRDLVLIFKGFVQQSEAASINCDIADDYFLLVLVLTVYIYVMQLLHNYIVHL